MLRATFTSSFAGVVLQQQEAALGVGQLDDGVDDHLQQPRQPQLAVEALVDAQQAPQPPLGGERARRDRAVAGTGGVRPQRPQRVGIAFQAGAMVFGGCHADLLHDGAGVAAAFGQLVGVAGALREARREHAPGARPAGARPVDRDAACQAVQRVGQRERRRPARRRRAPAAASARARLGIVVRRRVTARPPRRARAVPRSAWPASAQASAAAHNALAARWGCPPSANAAAADR